jgi:hypothetical protein
LISQPFAVWPKYSSNSSRNSATDPNDPSSNLGRFDAGISQAEERM